MATFSTDLGFGLPGEPTPFAFRAFGAPGFEASGTIVNVPEPATALLAAAGLLAMACRARRMQRAQ